MDKTKIRNFSIIAHIDHGKSTLADRILELTHTVAKRDLSEQILDSMDLEKERGITIKLNAVQIKYKDYIFHLIDTPGHVDFTYEVSRALVACEGALLVVDATQGIEAQTLANVYLALENGLEIIPIINKVDLPSADIEATKAAIEEEIGIDASEAICISAKTGLNVEQVLEAIVKQIPYPKNADDNKPLKALIFDSYYDKYKGVVLYVRIFEGKIALNDEFILMSSKKKFFVTELGVKTPYEVKKDHLEAGEVGWISASIREAKDINVGDTITLVKNPTAESLPGYKKLNPVVYTGFYPIDSQDYEALKEALSKISLSDSSITYEPESSKALGFGFRVGFLGLLHMEILQERLEREFNIDLIATAPSVEFHLFMNNGEKVVVSNPSLIPDKNFYNYIEEPYIQGSIILPDNYVGSIMELCQSKRGNYVNLEYIDNTKRRLIYQIPLVEIIFDFYDKLKSISKGYASFDYEIVGYQKSNLIKVDILLNKEKIDALSMVVHQDFADERSRELLIKLKEVIPRQSFEVPIQAVIGAKVIARETIKAYRKDVLSKLHAADNSRRAKLLDKQKKGKKRMKAIGSVEVPQEAFIAILKTGDTKKNK